MNTKLEEAIKDYCSMLPYPNSSANPNDDRRLYSISYFLVKSKEALNIEFFKQELRKNTHAGLDKLDIDPFEEFALNRIDEIEKGKYIIDKISYLVFPKFP